MGSLGRLFAVFGLRQSLWQGLCEESSPGFTAHHLRRAQEVELTQAGFHLMMSSAEIPGSPGEFASL